MGASVSAKICISAQLEHCVGEKERACMHHVDDSGFVLSGLLTVIDESLIHVLPQVILSF